MLITKLVTNGGFLCWEYVEIVPHGYVFILFEVSTLSYGCTISRGANTVYLSFRLRMRQLSVTPSTQLRGTWNMIENSNANLSYVRNEL
jgi:hypothetical protein